MGNDRGGDDANEVERRWATIQARMEAAAGVLARRGSIASRRTAGKARVFSVRFFDPVGGRQKAIYLGVDGELVRRAHALLDEYREGERQVEEVEVAARFAVATGAWVRRLTATRRRGPPRPGHRKRG